MPRDTRTGRSGRVVAGIAAAGLALVGWPSAAAAATGANTAPGSTASTVTATAVPTPTAASVTLATGDRVAVSTANGHTSYAVVGTSAGNRVFESYQTPSGDHFTVPAEAVPYLGGQLDASLFDVTALLRDGLTSGSRIPVSLTFADGATPAAPPGVTLTSVGPSGATGYLTPGSGAAFAAGLRASIGADVQAGRHPGTGTLFGGIASISLSASGVAAAAVQPRYPLHILQLDVTDLTGGPADNAFAVLLNTDSAGKAQGAVPVSGGLARIAVPAGNYSAVVGFIDFDAQGNVTASRMVSLMDFVVAAAGTTTVTFDERTATVPTAVSTPRPAVQDYLDVEWWRKDAGGNLVEFGTGAFGSGPPVYTNTQPAPTTGTFRYHVQWGGAGPSTGRSYRYDVAFASDVVPADQNYTVRPDQLATVKQSFYTDPASADPGSFLSGPQDAFLNGGYSIIGGPRPAGALTQYLGTGEGDQWWQAYWSPSGVQYDGDLHTFQAGRTYRLEWAHGPLAPNAGVHSGPTNFYPCLACASPGALSLGFSEGGDSEPDHTAISFLGGATHYTLYQDGVVVIDRDNVTGAEMTGLPSTPTVLREVYDTDFTGLSGVSQSTATHTDVTFTYRPGSDPRSTLPSEDYCDYANLVAAPCQIQPVLSLNYQLATDYANTSRVGPQSLSLDVSHLSYDGYGSRARITSATVSVSFDGGKTWHPAAVLGAHGHYFARWQNPHSAAGTSPELRVTATDAIGGSITQTVVNAYTIAASAH